jgi:hypothetical protein
LQAALAEADLIDRLQWVRTPIRLGTGVPAPAMPSEARGPGSRETRLGQDVLTEADVHGTD